MKRKIALLLAILSLALTACRNTLVHMPTLDDTLPWDTATDYEKSTFTVERYKMKRDGKNTVRDGAPIAVGEYVTEIDINGTDTTVKNAFTLTYSADEASTASKAGMTDSFQSECVFATTSGYPAYSYRNFTLAPRENLKDKSHTIIANYKADEAYGLQATTSSIDMYGEAKTLALKASGQLYDNEQLYVMLRAFSNVKTEGSETFQLVNLFDAHNNGAFGTHAMSLSIAKTKEALFLDERFLAFDTVTQNDKGEDLHTINRSETDGVVKARIDCLVGTLSKTGDKSGPAQTVYFADVPFKIASDDSTQTTRKVILQIVTREYAGTDEAFNMVFTLTDYTTTKPTE